MCAGSVFWANWHILYKSILREIVSKFQENLKKSYKILKKQTKSTIFVFK